MPVEYMITETSPGIYVDTPTRWESIKMYMIITPYLIVISPYLLVLYIARFFSPGWKKWYDESFEHGLNDFTVAILFMPILIVDAIIHPIRTYKFFINN